MQKNDSAIMALVVSENASIKIPIIEANPAVLLNIVDKFSFKNLICDCVCNINKAMYVYIHCLLFSNSNLITQSDPIIISSLLLIERCLKHSIQLVFDMLLYNNNVNNLIMLQIYEIYYGVLID